MPLLSRSLTAVSTAFFFRDTTATPWVLRVVLGSRSAVEMIASPELLAKAQEEFRNRVGEGYDAPIPKDVFPKAMGSFKK